jgi:hypothetical protein
MTDMTDPAQVPGEGNTQDWEAWFPGDHHVIDHHTLHLNILFSPRIFLYYDLSQGVIICLLVNLPIGISLNEAKNHLTSFNT